MAKEFKEKIITINLRRAFEKPRTKRTKASLFILKNAVKKETRKKEISISNKVNEFIWKKGLFKSPRKITVKVVPEKDTARVYLPDEKPVVKEEKKKARTLKEKAEEKLKEAGAGKPAKKKEEKKEENPKESSPEKEKRAPEEKTKKSKKVKAEKKEEKK